MASKPSKEETYWRDPSPHKIEPLSYCPDDLRDPRTFPHCSRPTSSRYSVLAGFPGHARHFLLLVSNMGRFPELTPVCRQTTEAWLSTPGAGDRGCAHSGARWLEGVGARHEAQGVKRWGDGRGK